MFFSGTHTHTHMQDRRIQHTRASSFSSGGGEQREGRYWALYGVREVQQVGDAEQMWWTEKRRVQRRAGDSLFSSSPPPSMDVANVN